METHVEVTEPKTRARSAKSIRSRPVICASSDFSFPSMALTSDESERDVVPERPIRIRSAIELSDRRVRTWRCGWCISDQEDERDRSGRDDAQNEDLWGKSSIFNSNAGIVDNYTDSRGVPTNGERS